MKIKVLLFFLIVSSLAIHAEKPETALIQNMENAFELPRNFRTTKDPFKEQIEKPPTREGLDELNLSGSGQFSEKSLDCLLKKVNHKGDFYLLDLREESHGFVNGIAISWFALRDWENVGKTQQVIVEEEKERLLALLKLKNVSLSIRIKKNPNGLSMPIMQQLPPIIVETVATEQELSTKRSLNYVRLAVTDQVKPTDYSVDRFIEFYHRLNNGRNNWVHVHCLAGIGRTTTFMAMFDMMKNAKKVSFHEIVTRQRLIGGRDVSLPSKNSWKNELIQERYHFLKEFYSYCKENKDDYQTSWTLYLLEKRVVMAKV